jgi:hypothetical protein
MQPLVIESEVMRVGVLPDFGARVVSLFDKRAAREWIFQGGVSADAGEDAVFGAEEAAGWDECFPTVSPCDASATPWRRRLRDHGDLWGRPWTVDARSDQLLATSCATGEFAFTRTLAVEGSQLTASYRVENRTLSDMPYLWALHGLLAAPAGERIVLPGCKELGATYLGRHGKSFALPSVPWPDTGRELGFRLDAVQPDSSGFAGKFYTEAVGRAAAVGRDGQWLVIGWAPPVTTLGLWLNYHGWPAPPRGHHLALEPTTAPADSLVQALGAGKAAWIGPGATASWTITLTLSSTAPGNSP